MTYCVAMSLQEGLLFASDSRTNAGLDHVSTFSKMSVFEKPGERVIVEGLQRVRSGVTVNPRRAGAR